MLVIGADPEATVVRQVFTRWRITVPRAFQETFVADGGYWHAWDGRRSISLSSVVIDDRKGRPVASRRILKRMPATPGRRVRMSPGLDGWAVVIDQPQPARATCAVSGMIAVDGRVLIATVTAEDLDWATMVWESIEYTTDVGRPDQRDT